MSSFSKEELGEVSSWLLDQQKCVSLGAISMQQGVSRHRASQMLQHIVQEDTTAASSRVYEVTKCVVQQEEVKCDVDGEEVIPCTVFKLITEDFKKDAMDVDEGCLYAAALKSVSEDVVTESLSTAHERDMALFRDMLKDNTLRKESIGVDLIAPAPEIQTLLKQQAAAAQEKVVEMMEETVTTAVASGNATLSRGPKKATTAANFFGSRMTTTTSKTTAVASKNSEPKTSTSQKKSMISLSEDGKENAVSKEKPSQVTSKTTKTSSAPASQKPVASNNKTSTPAANDTRIKQPTAGDKKVGDVDDFVGDMEDDDDESVVAQQEPQDDDNESMELEQEAKPKQKSKRRVVVEDSDLDDEMDEDDEKPKKTKAKEVVSGAMDAFATKKIEKPTGTGTGKRRRKKLVDKTTVDANGYLHTETQEIWEDVPSDEDVEVLTTKKAPAAAATKTQNAAKKGAASNNKKHPMKQGNLMGFFKKK